MAWSYGANPAGSSLDEVRLLVGDTNTNDQQLQDAEVNWFISQRSDNIEAAADCAEAIAARYARQANIGQGKLKVDAAARFGHYQGLAQQLRMQARGKAGATIIVGGQTISGKDALNDDPDAVQPAFAIGMDDEPSVPPVTLPDGSNSSSPGND